MNQLRSSPYKVKREECYLVPNDFSSSSNSQMKTDYSTDDEDHDIQYTNSSPLPAVDIPNVLTNLVEGIPFHANGPRNDELSLLLPQLKLPLAINLPLILIQLTIQKCSPLHGLDLDVKLNALNI